MASEYIITLADPVQIPDLFKKGYLKGRAESRIAFVGRSNVGKSSLINALLGIRIARVSATPGKTRAIHFFTWPEKKRIVADLPGYGFAKVARAEKMNWSRLMDAYFEADTALEGVLMLFDSRHGPTDADLEALDYFSSKGMPIQIVMTKVDQLKSQSDRAHRKKEAASTLAEFGIAAENLMWVSIKSKEGLKPLKDLFK
jgi:GTP-binding protein